MRCVGGSVSWPWSNRSIDFEIGRPNRMPGWYQRGARVERDRLSGQVQNLLALASPTTAPNFLGSRACFAHRLRSIDASLARRRRGPAPRCCCCCRPQATPKHPLDGDGPRASSSRWNGVGVVPRSHARPIAAITFLEVSHVEVQVAAGRGGRWGACGTTPPLHRPHRPPAALRLDFDGGRAPIVPWSADRWIRALLGRPSAAESYPPNERPCQCQAASKQAG